MNTNLFFVIKRTLKKFHIISYSNEHNDDKESSIVDKGTETKIVYRITRHNRVILMQKYSDFWNFDI